MDKGRILESWKEIAAHLNRNVRTCQMWERDHGLPVHRLDGSPKARVFAYP
ncbi:MAG: tetratricopeptide repeat protein, partial [Candidatus Aminicenantes bacterium]